MDKIEEWMIFCFLCLAGALNCVLWPTAEMKLAKDTLSIVVPALIRSIVFAIFVGLLTKWILIIIKANHGK